MYLHDMEAAEARFAEALRANPHLHEIIDALKKRVASETSAA